MAFTISVRIGSCFTKGLTWAWPYNNDSYYITPIQTNKQTNKKSLLCTGIRSVLCISRYITLDIRIVIRKEKNGIRTSLIKSPSSHCSLCVLTDKTDILIKTLGYFHPMFVVKNTSFKAKTWSFPNSSQLAFVPTHNHLFNLELSQHRIKYRVSAYLWFAETHNVNIYPGDWVACSLFNTTL